jgi:glycosyltransferase involved in cell wall biosynthesis
MSNVTVSIILRSKNEARWLRHLLTKLKKQTFQDFEVVLVDNLSEDQSVDLVRDYGGRITKIDNYAPGLALNIGCRVAAGKYFVFISSHCLPTTDTWLENFVTEFESLAGSRCVGIYGRQIATDISSAQTVRDLTITFGPEARDQFRDPFFHNANSIITKQAWLSLPFDDSAKNIEDRIWAEGHQKNGNYIRYTPDACVAHYHGIHHDNVKNRLKSTQNTLVRRGFSDIYPVKHLFDNICVIIANKATETVLDSTIKQMEELKRQNLISCVILVGTENCVSTASTKIVDFQIPLRADASYFNNIPIIFDNIQNLGLHFDNCFIVDTSYQSRSAQTLSEMYDYFLERDARIISAVYRETRNYLITAVISLPSTNKKFLASSRWDKPNDILIKCAGYCTILTHSAMVSWDHSSYAEVDLFEVKNLAEVHQIIEYSGGEF